jgi:hypothetical protein
MPWIMPGGFGPDNAPPLSSVAVGSAVATVIDVRGEPVASAPEALHDLESFDQA